MRHQGAWERWENAVERKVTWNEIWIAEPHRIKFLIQAVYDVFPRPSNLHTWAVAETPACPLCSKRVAAPWHLEKEDTSGGMTKCLRPSLKPSALDLCGQSSFVPPRKPLLLSELGSRPVPVKRSPADIVLVSESTKQATLLELTVPWEDCLEEAFERKLSKYAGLVSDCQQAGWRVRCLPVEVGCRGFAVRSLARYLSSLGIVGERKRRTICNTTEAAERSSEWLWLKRGEPWSHGS
ncbi:hypothetical protein SRHO_G00293260 [Serrasalmus rhombeus]